MKAIPDDIERTAAEVWATLPREAAGITAIARAILAERKRCAETTNKYRKDVTAGGEARLVAAYIHREIMSAS